MFALAMEAKKRDMGVVGSTQNILDFIAAKLKDAMERPFPDTLQVVSLALWLLSAAALLAARLQPFRHPNISLDRQCKSSKTMVSHLRLAAMYGNLCPEPLKPEMWVGHVHPGEMVPLTFAAFCRWCWAQSLVW